MIHSAFGPYFLPNHNRFQEIHSKRSALSAFLIVLIVLQGYKGEPFSVRRISQFLVLPSRSHGMYGSHADLGSEILISVDYPRNQACCTANKLRQVNAGGTEFDGSNK